MGNRVVFTIDNKKLNEENIEKSKQLGIYLHWNGGADSVEAFLKYAELRNFRQPEQDNCGWARLCQVISNFFGGDGTSIGIDTLNNLDVNNSDNGTILFKDWKITRVLFTNRKQNSHKLIDMLLQIDEAQPEREKLGIEFIKKSLEKETN